MTPLLRTLDEAERFDWLRLIRSEQVGPRTFAGLMTRFGTARAALDALPRIAGRGRAVRLAPAGEVEAEMEAARRANLRFVAVCEPAYPPSLRAIDSAPPVLAVRGSLDLLQRATVAIVGSRNASAAGLVFTERLAQRLGVGGYAIASGLARGIDERAHRGALLGGTIAVLAGGHERIYPSEHVGLAADIVESGGTILTEMPVAWEPRGRDFPRRNRIVSGLSLGTVVVEAARRSGSLITARFANEQGREVFAVPGSPLDPRAEGTNDLIRQGATLCTGADDVIDVLRPQHGRPPPSTHLFEDDGRPAPGDIYWDELDPDGTWTSAAAPDRGLAQAAGPDPAPDPRATIAGLIGPAPVTVDDLVRLTGFPAGAVQTVLVELEIGGLVDRQGNAVRMRIA